MGHGRQYVSRSDEIWERWTKLHQNTAEIARAMHLKEPEVERVIAEHLTSCWESV